MPFLDPVEIPVPAYHVAEIPDEVNPVGILAVVFPAPVMATGLVRASVIRGEILGLAFRAEAFLVRNVAEGGDFVREYRTAVDRKSACRRAAAARGVAALEAGC